MTECASSDDNRYNKVPPQIRGTGQIWWNHEALTSTSLHVQNTYREIRVPPRQEHHTTLWNQYLSLAVSHPSPRTWGWIHAMTLHPEAEQFKYILQFLNSIEAKQLKVIEEAYNGI